MKALTQSDKDQILEYAQMQIADGGDVHAGLISALIESDRGAIGAHLRRLDFDRKITRTCSHVGREGERCKAPLPDYVRGNFLRSRCDECSGLTPGGKTTRVEYPPPVTFSPPATFKPPASLAHLAAPVAIPTPPPDTSAALVLRTDTVNGDWPLTIVRAADGSEEPTLEDVVIGEALDFERPRKVRDLIERLEREGEFGGAPRRGIVRVPAGGGKPFAPYLLTEEQTMHVVFASKTETARKVRATVIAVFLAWRKGRLLPALPAHGALTPEAMAAAMTAAMAPMANMLGQLAERLTAPAITAHAPTRQPRGSDWSKKMADARRAKKRVTRAGKAPRKIVAEVGSQTARRTRHLKRVNTVATRGRECCTCQRTIKPGERHYVNKVRRVAWHLGCSGWRTAAR